MAGTPGYGGTNGVEDLDLGQPGSARATAKDARYVVRVIRAGGETRSILQQIPHAAIAFEDNLGPGDERIRWEGTLKVDAMATLRSIDGELFAARDGYARNASGDRGSFSAARIAPTTLLDFDGGALGTKVRIVSHRLDRVRKITGDANMNFLTRLTVEFRKLG